MNEVAVARAIVGYEVGGLLSSDPPPLDSRGMEVCSITCQEIIDKYGLDWGYNETRPYVDEYFLNSHHHPHARAARRIRHQLNRFFGEGILAKIQDPKGKVLRRDRNIVFIDGLAQAPRLGHMRVLRTGQTPSPGDAGFVTAWPMFM